MLFGPSSDAVCADIACYKQDFFDFSIIVLQHLYTTVMTYFHQKLFHLQDNVLYISYFSLAAIFCFSNNVGSAFCDMSSDELMTVTSISFMQNRCVIIAAVIQNKDNFILPR